MLQIIGWIGCVLMAIKALELISNPAYRDETGALNWHIVVAAMLAGFGSIGFAVLLYAQGELVRDITF